MPLKISSKFKPKIYFGSNKTFAQIANDKAINKIMRVLFFVSDIEIIIPRGIDNNGVNMATPGKPKFLLNLTKNLLDLLKTTFFRFGNILSKPLPIASPKYVKAKTPNMPPPTVVKYDGIIVISLLTKAITKPAKNFTVDIKKITIDDNISSTF